MTRLKSAANGAPVPRNPFTGKRVITIGCPLRTVVASCLVARELFCPNVVFIHSGIDEHSARRCNHSRRPGNVKNRTAQVAYVFGKHSRSNMAQFHPAIAVEVPSMRVNVGTKRKFVFELSKSQRASMNAASSRYRFA